MAAGVWSDPAALGKDGAPPSAEKSWSPPRLQKYERELAQGQPEQPAAENLVNPKRVYDLPELIDIAERNHPETKIAWERARQAAAAVGLSESFYYPYLMASAGVGYDRAFIPFPTLAADLRPLVRQLVRNPQAALQSAETQNQPLPNVSIVGGGTLTTEAVASRAALSVKWLLFDFGERSAVVDEAKERLMMANVGFNGTHQKIVFEVTQKFYELGNARQKVTVGKSAFHAAQTVEQAVRARLERGLALKTELLQA
ncbi:MAG TPA: TolC family protein, partial [Chthoniobacteraceae bacterium]